MSQPHSSPTTKRDMIPSRPIPNDFHLMTDQERKDLREQRFGARPRIKAPTPTPTPNKENEPEAQLPLASKSRKRTHRSQDKLGSKIRTEPQKKKHKSKHGDQSQTRHRPKTQITRLAPPTLYITRAKPHLFFKPRNGAMPQETTSLRLAPKIALKKDSFTLQPIS
jgi:hypothetical protein